MRGVLKESLKSLFTGAFQRPGTIYAKETAERINEEIQKEIADGEIEKTELIDLAVTLRALELLEKYVLRYGNMTAEDFGTALLACKNRGLFPAIKELDLP